MILRAEPQAATESVQISAAPPPWWMSPWVCCGRRVGAALAGQRGADVGDDHPGAGLRHHDGDLASDAAARAGDHDNLAFHHACHGRSPCVAFSAAD